jgi:hypothetical protein
MWNLGVEGYDFLVSSSLPIGSLNVGEFSLPISGFEKTRRRTCIGTIVVCYK